MSSGPSVEFLKWAKGFLGVGSKFLVVVMQSANDTFQHPGEWRLWGWYDNEGEMKAALAEARLDASYKNATAVDLRGAEHVVYR